MLFTHRLGQWLRGARACPHTGGPARLLSGAHCCSEISYSLAWDREVPSYRVRPRGGTVGVLVVERLCTGRRRLARSAPLSPKTEAGVTHTHTLSFLGGCLVQSAQRFAHGLNQAAGGGPLSWPPRMSYQPALNTLHTRCDSRPLGSLKTAM